MKFTRLTACILALATATGAMSALGEGAHSVFSLGLGFQYWDAKDVSDLDMDDDGLAGMNLIARVQPSEFFGIDLRLGGSGVWDDETYYVDGKKYKTDVSLMCWPVEAGIVLMLPINDTITLYGGPGVGYYYYDIDIERSRRHGHHYHSEKSKHIKLEDDFGWYAVAGLSVRLAPHVSLFGEARYTDTETSFKDEDASKFDCSGAAVQVGFMFDF